MVKAPNPPPSRQPGDRGMSPKPPHTAKPPPPPPPPAPPNPISPPNRGR